MGLDAKPLAAGLVIVLLSTTACSSPATSSGSSQSGVCAPGGHCAPRYENAEILVDANLERYTTRLIPGLSGNLGLGNLAPETTCEAAASPDLEIDLERTLNLALAETEWENVLAWSSGSSVWRQDESYVFYQNFDLVNAGEDFILETLEVPISAMSGASTVLITCAFQQ